VNFNSYDLFPISMRINASLFYATVNI
jgi:hypothetical protein